LLPHSKARLILAQPALRLAKSAAGGFDADLLLMASIIFRTLGFLLILFVVVYIGTENTHTIDFRFSLLLEKPVRTSAALAYFAVFAVGVIGGTLLNAGRASSGPGKDGPARSKKK